MGKRSLSGACYVLIVVACFLCRIFLSPILFDIFFLFMCAVGTYEIARAVKKYSMRETYIVSIIYGTLLPLVFIVLKYTGKDISMYLPITAGFVVCEIIILFVFKVVCKEKFNKFLVSLLPIVYPFIGILAMLLINAIDGEEGLVGLLFLFVVPAISDTFAYLFGSLFNKIKKGNAKRLCPTISPNKTWAGAVFALIGGIISGLLIYLVVKPDDSLNILLLFAFIGLIASIINIFGDLFESLIKRRVKIKDMGKIMPGHGGVMDRIDGMSFVSIYIYLVTLFI